MLLERACSDKARARHGQELSVKVQEGGSAGRGSRAAGAVLRGAGGRGRWRALRRARRELAVRRARPEHALLQQRTLLGTGLTHLR